MLNADLVELRLSNYQIEKATARLAYQRAAIRKLGFDADLRISDIAHEALVSMESRLAELLVKHAGLVEQQRRPLSAVRGKNPAFRRSLVAQG